MKHLVFQALALAPTFCGLEPLTPEMSASTTGSPLRAASALFYGDGRIQGTLGGGCLEAEIQQRAIQSLRTGESTTFDLLLDHDFGWDDGLICGGKVFGVILPNAQKLGEEFWTELAERKTSMSWGVATDFS